MRPILLMSLVITLLMASLAQVSFESTVEGKVLDESGKPVSKIMVDAPYRGAITGIMPIFRTWTDENGNFILKGLPSGENLLFAVDTQRGYVDGRNGIFSGDPSPYKEVTIQAGRHMTGVVVPIIRGAKITMSVVDSETGNPVAAVVRISRPDLDVGGSFITSTNLKGQFQVVLPNLPFRIEVRAADYRPWRYSQMDNQGKETFDIALAPADDKVLTVKLQKMKMQ
jgi:hypothetical protein